VGPVIGGADVEEGARVRRERVAEQAGRHVSQRRAEPETRYGCSLKFRRENAWIDLRRKSA
jgi:hypothetical protein